MGDAVDGCGDGAAFFVRRERALGPASGFRIRRRGDLVLGRDGPHARLHALSARGRGRRSVVVPALSGVGGCRGPTTCAVRVPLAPPGWIAAPPPPGVLSSSGSVRACPAPGAWI